MKTQIFSSAKVTYVSETSVELVRSFRANKELVYRAYTEPGLIKQWMLGPPGWEMPVCTMDLKVGGHFSWRWRNRGSNKEFGFFGMFTAIRPNEMMTHTQNYDPGSAGGNMGRECVVHLIFLEVEGYTNVTTRMEFRSAEDMKLAVSTGMTEGMEMSYRALENTLQKI